MELWCDPSDEALGDPEVAAEEHQEECEEQRAAEALKRREMEVKHDCVLCPQLLLMENHNHL